VTEKLPNYGGQALIEGVLMRGEKSAAIAMRAPDGEIVYHTEELSGIYKTNWVKIPFLRGLVGLWDSLGLGMRSLTISANIQSEEEDEKIEGFALFFTLLLSLAFSIGLFMLLPAAVSHFIENWLGVENVWLANLIEGGIRLILLVGYIWAIGLMKDVKRVFSFHGAEHKTINAFEAGSEMTPEEIKKHSLVHPRCGTSFMLTLVLLSVIIFSLFGPFDTIWIRLGARILLIPVLAGVSYEYIKLTAKYIDSPIVKFLIAPNLALQKLTTNEPDLEIIEVALAAFNKMKELELQYSE
jgi:uncharacterized protein YqhQ